MPSPAVRQILLSGRRYVGPGDIVPGAYGWYGLRAYSRAKAKARARCCNVVRASDSATKDIFLTGRGDIDIAALTDFLAGTTGKVVTLYNQAEGTGPNVTQATDSNRPAITLNGLNGKPVLTFTGSAMQLAAANAAITAPWSIAFVAKRTAGFTSNNFVFGGYDGTNSLNLYFRNTASTAAFLVSATGIDLTSVADSSWHALQGVASTDANAVYADGTNSITGQAGTASNWAVNRIAIGANVFNSAALQGDFFQGGVWGSSIALTAEQANALAANDRAYGAF